MVGEPAYTGTEYFAHQEGLWKVYRVDSIVYDDFLGKIISFKYQVKEVNDAFFTDSQGEKRMRIERFYRKDNNDPWTIKNVWTSSLTMHHALKTEENITFIKLSFPVKRNLTWNGNQYNNLVHQNYRITEMHKPANIDNLLFDSTITVLQKDFTTLIGRDLQYEVYATGVGMIIKKFVALQKEIDGTITRGVDYSYHLIDFGKD